MPKLNKNIVTGVYKSFSTRRDARYTPWFTAYIQRGEDASMERLGESAKTEAIAMKSINRAFDDDPAITRGAVIESRTVRSYHRHRWGEGDNARICTICWGVKLA